MKLKALPTVPGAESGEFVITGAPVTLKLWRRLFAVKPLPPAWVACSVMSPGAVGVTVKVGPAPLIVANPVEPEATVSVMARPELAEGVTVKAPALTRRSAIAAKLTDWVPAARTAPVTKKLPLPQAEVGPVASTTKVSVLTTLPRLAMSEMVRVPGTRLGFSRPRMVLPVTLSVRR